MLLSFLFLILAAALIPFLVHLLLSRAFGLFREAAHRQKIVLLGNLIGLIPLAVLFLVWRARFQAGPEAGDAGPGLYLFGVYLLFAYSYFHIFNMSETARRVRILMDGAAGGNFDPENIGAKYTGEHMVSIRLRRLVSLRELKRSDNRYLPGRGLLFLPARVIPLLHRLLFPGHDPLADSSGETKTG